MIHYGELLKVYFTAAHDPTTLNRQHYDEGPEYRSAILLYRRRAEERWPKGYVKELNGRLTYSKAWWEPRDHHARSSPLRGAFYPAEAEHQHFLDRNPTQGYIANVDIPLLKGFIAMYPELFHKGDQSEVPNQSYRERHFPCGSPSCSVVSCREFFRHTGAPGRPIVVELFTSRDAPDARPPAALLKFLDRTQPVPGALVIALSEHVDHWDAHLGWRDRFPRPSSHRGRKATTGVFTPDSYTPQAVIDGASEAVARQ